MIFPWYFQEFLQISRYNFLFFQCGLHTIWFPYLLRRCMGTLIWNLLNLGLASFSHISKAEKCIDYNWISHFSRFPLIFPWYFSKIWISMIFPWLEKLLSFFQVFQVLWEPCKETSLLFTLFAQFSFLGLGRQCDLTLSHMPRWYHQKHWQPVTPKIVLWHHLWSNGNTFSRAIFYFRSKATKSTILMIQIFCGINIGRKRQRLYICLPYKAQLKSRRINLIMLKARCTVPMVYLVVFHKASLLWVGQKGLHPAPSLQQEAGSISVFLTSTNNWPITGLSSYPLIWHSMCSQGHINVAISCVI